MKGKLNMKLLYAKELYPKIVLLKAAYTFVDRAYIHLDCDDQNFMVELIAKDESDSVLPDEFTNEMLIQSVRNEIAKSTKTIRELTVARSLASTLINNPATNSDDELVNVDENVVLKDWFSEND